MHKLFSELGINDKMNESQVMDCVRQAVIDADGMRIEKSIDIIKQVIPDCSPTFSDQYIAGLTAMDIVRQAFLEPSQEPSLTLAQMKAEEAASTIEDLFGPGAVGTSLEETTEKAKAKRIKTDQPKDKKISKMDLARQIVTQKDAEGMKSGEIVKMLSDQLGLSIVAARTYLFNCRKENKNG